MKRILTCTGILIAAVLLLQSNSSGVAAKVTFKRVDSYQVSTKQAKQVAKANIAHLVMLKGNRLAAARGSTLYVAKNKRGGTGILVINKQASKGVRDKILVGVSAQFQIIGESDVKMVYCSCGNNTIETEGDGCIYYATSSGNRCGGACSGNNSDKSCSITVLNLETGAVSSEL